MVLSGKEGMGIRGKRLWLAVQGVLVVMEMVCILAINVSILVMIFYRFARYAVEGNWANDT